VIFTSEFKYNHQTAKDNVGYNGHHGHVTSTSLSLSSYVQMSTLPGFISKTHFPWVRMVC